jgi:aldehyde dehydrogenase (NAD+)
LVDRRVADSLIEELKKGIVEMLGEKPSEFEYYGRIINDHHFNRIVGLLENARSSPGVTIEHGGRYDPATKFIEPTVISGIGHDFSNHPVMREEIFGPLLPVIKVDSVEEAIALVKLIGDTPLACYPFSKSTSTLEKIFEAIPTGMYCANDTMIQGVLHQYPFGGVGESGMGSYHGKFSFQAFTRAQGFVVRNPYTDIVNTTRYVNLSGDYNSLPAKLTRLSMYTPVPSDFYLNLRYYWRKLHLSFLLFVLAVLLLGFFLGKSIE